MLSLRASVKRLVVDTPLEPVARKVHAAVTKFLSTARCYPLVRKHLAGKCGLEIGGPSDVFDNNLPIYRDIQALDNCVFAEATHWEGARAAGQTFLFDAGMRTGNNIITEGVTLDGIADAKYDFALSSHSLEHFANPLKALENWKRVLKPQGFLLLLLPDKHRTFDYRRPVTTLDHLLEDYARDTGEDDMTHLEEFVTLWDYEKFPIANSIAEHRERYRDNFHQRLMHHHVFDLQSAVRLVEYAGFKVLSAERCRPNHLILFAQAKA
ncbi:MAG: methyltransferase domain-containing protein [Terriglobales bacterium]